MRLVPVPRFRRLQRRRRIPFAAESGSHFSSCLYGGFIATRPDVAEGRAI